MDDTQEQIDPACDSCEDDGCEFCDPRNHQSLWMKGIAIEVDSIQDVIDAFEAEVAWLKALQADRFTLGDHDNGHFWFHRDPAAAPSEAEEAALSDPGVRTAIEEARTPIRAKTHDRGSFIE